MTETLKMTHRINDRDIARLKDRKIGSESRIVKEAKTVTRENVVLDLYGGNNHT